MALLLGLLGPTGVQAQLRPYDPVDWDVFEHGRTFHVSAGGQYFFGQRASLAGTEGDLWEVGTFRAGFRSDRIAVEAAGTAVRVFNEKSSFASPLPSTSSRPLGMRRDAGDHRIATTVALSDPARPAAVAIHFGTRLPTTDNRVGLERDQTDFFGLAAARYDWAGYRTTLQAGVGIHGTREPEYEQSDVLVFSAGLERVSGSVRPALFVVGHADGLPNRAVRGNEELAELRLRLRTGGARWLEAQWVHGLTTFSPSGGVMVAFGWSR